MSVLRKMSGVFFGIPYDDEYKSGDRSEVQFSYSNPTMHSTKKDGEGDTSIKIEADTTSRIIQEHHEIGDGEDGNETCEGDGVEMEEIRSSLEIKVSVHQPPPSHLQPHEEDNEIDGGHEQGDNNVMAGYL